MAGQSANDMYSAARYYLENGYYKSAIKTAEKSMALSKEAKNDFYVQSNAKSIEEWSKMK